MSTERTPLSRQRIAHAALELIDDEGLDKLTMRRLAGRLDVEAMSLYHHVGDKSALLVAVADVVLAEITGSTNADWRARITEVLGQFRTACLAHPGAVPLVVATGFTTPSALLPIDTILGALEAAGLDERRRVQSFRLLLSFALGAISCELAETGAAIDADPPTTGALADDTAADATGADATSDVVADAEFGHLAAVGSLLWECDYDADFSDGLRQLLDSTLERAAGD